MGRNCEDIDIDKDKLDDIISRAIEFAGSITKLEQQISVSHGVVRLWRIGKYRPNTTKMKMLLRYVGDIK